MKSPSLLFIVILLFQIATLAQAPDTMWTRTFNVTETDFSSCIQQTTDLGFVVTGYTEGGVTASDIFLLKIDAVGNHIWTKIWDANSGEYGYCVQQTTDGGFIVSGSIGGGDPDVWLIKTNSDGDTLWTKRIFYSGNQADNHIEQTSDGGYIITTGTNFGGYGDVLLIKTTGSGDTLWTRTFGGSDADMGYCVKQTSDGGYIIIGLTASFGAGYSDFYLIKTDAGGNSEWEKTFGGSGSDKGYSVQQTSDGGYIVAGTTSSFGAGSDDAWLIKTDGNGDTLWTNTFGGVNLDWLFAVEQTSDSGYIVAGQTRSFSYTDEAWLIKTDINGNILWTKLLGGDGEDLSRDVKQTVDGGYILAARSASFNVYGRSDVWLVKVAPDISAVDETYLGLPYKYELLQNYPNPFNPSTKIKYSIPQLSNVVIIAFDILGNEIETLINEEKQVGTYEVTWYAENLPSGVYFYQLKAGSYIETKKVVLLK